MSTLNPRRFANVATLRKVHQDRLMSLLVPHEEYLSGRAVDFDNKGIDYPGLVGVLLKPDEKFPLELADALHHINELATEDGMDDLLEAADAKGLDLDLDDDPTPADVALSAWLVDQDLVERALAEQFLTRPRSFEYAVGSGEPPVSVTVPDADALAVMEKALDEYFDKKKRGRHSRVFVYPKEDGIWFLVRHGEPMDRRGVIKDGESEAVFFRPEKYDVVVYDQALDELRVNARNKGEKELYRKQIGQHMFGDEGYFADAARYTLDPLIEDGVDALVCSDVPGLEYVLLKEVHYFRGGAQKEVEIRKAKDLFAAYAEKDRPLPGGRMMKASFEVRFSDAKASRTLAVRLPRTAQYTRDDDSACLDTWLIKRGFVNGHNDPED